ncbi:MAG: carboxypeptidase-like regulatory domain-containing protein [Pyrinomonadaceae bacterium]
MRSIWLTLLLVMSMSISARASCMMDPSPPCQAFWRAEVVFSGTATQVFYSTTYQKGEGKDQWNHRDRIARFTVDDLFRGQIGKQVDVIATEIMATPFTWPDGSPGMKAMGETDCEYKFKEGERYLVYAHFRKNNDGTLSVGYNRTRPLSQAAEDLEFIRGLKNAEAGARVYGIVRQNERELKNGGNTRIVGPVASARIVIEGGKREFEANTDADGRFVITGLPAGEYEVRAILPAHLTSYPAQKIRVVERGCAEVNFYTEANGRISGRVVDPLGQPVPKMRIDLALADQDQTHPNPQTFWAYADEEGRYEFKSIPAGRYHLGIRLNAIRDADFPYARTYYPAASGPEAATVFELQEGQKIEHIDFVMPLPLARRTIEGVAVWPDGRPVAGAGVSLMLTEYPYRFATGGGGTTDTNGHFSVTAFADLSYWINAVVNSPQGKQMHAEPVDIARSGDVKGVKLVVTSPMGTCERCRFRYWPKKKT